MSISSANPTVATFTRYRYVAVGAETSVSGADANGSVLAYSPGREQVYLNGVMLVRGQDYTATTGSSITGLTALVASDVVEVLAFTSFAVAAGVAQDESPSSPAEGQLWLDTNGTAPGVQFARWSKTMSGGVTSVTGTDDNSITLAYTAGYESVYRNGILLSRVNDYTATNGTSITLIDATIANDIIEVFAPTSIGFADAIPNSLVDAKGDLITASSNNTPAILTVGSNGETLVADSSATTGLRWQGNFAAGKNVIINGDFRINQRAFTSNTSSQTYNFDRFWQSNSGGTATVTPQTFTTGSAPVSGYEGRNFVQIVTASQSASSDHCHYSQTIESVRTLAGQTATISFWAKAGSGTPSIGVEFYQYFGSGGSPSAAVSTAAGAVTISTSWTRYTLTVSIPSISGKTIGTSNNDGLLVNLWVSSGSDYNARSSSIGIQNGTFQIWGVQVEAGSVATAFQTATGTLAGELAACQRYYIRNTQTATNQPLSNHGPGTSTTNADINITLPVSMRVSPTAVEFANLAVSDGVNARTNVTAVTLNAASTQFANCSFTVASGLTQYRSYALLNQTSTTAYLGFTAEL